MDQTAKMSGASPLESPRFARGSDHLRRLQHCTISLMLSNTDVGGKTGAKQGVIQQEDDQIIDILQRKWVYNLLPERA